MESKHIVFKALEGATKCVRFHFQCNMPFILLGALLNGKKYHWHWTLRQLPYKVVHVCLWTLMNVRHIVMCALHRCRSGAEGLEISPEPVFIQPQDK